jgi:geranylgeranyl diphosphate synthase, type II
VPAANAKRESQARVRRNRATGSFERQLSRYRDITTRHLLSAIPKKGPSYLYDLVAAYPSRFGKGLRPALCFATCAALGGNRRQALNSAVAIELLHNAFLVHDDVQDGSDVRRGRPTLLRQHGIPIAVNVGNATNLLALRRLMENRGILGAEASWQIMQETERMMTHSLEGQAIELAWIRDNVCDLSDRDYLQMCLKKTSWYSFIYPMRVGALVARPGRLDHGQFCRLGWYFGAAFQIQDDILNLTADYEKYGKEIGGDLWEGKRTLMLIHLLQHCKGRDGVRLQRFLRCAREERSTSEVRWVYDLMVHHHSIDYAHRAARQLAGAALLEGLAALRELPDSPEKRFILEMILYVVDRDR